MKYIALLLGATLWLLAQDKDGTTQRATNCAQNFGPGSRNNTGTITCYGVDKNLAAQISELVILSKRDSKTLKDISDKIETLLREFKNLPPTTTVIQQAPNGINIGPGAIVPNPQVNNFGPPPAKITWTEEVTTPLPESGAGEKVMKVHIMTDRSIPGAVIGVIFSGPITMTEEYWKAHNPTLTPSGAYEIDISSPLSANGAPVPNSMALKVTLPSAFSLGQDLAVVVTSKVDVHLLSAVDITR